MVAALSLALSLALGGGSLAAAAWRRLLCGGCLVAAAWRWLLGGGSAAATGWRRQLGGGEAAAAAVEEYCDNIHSWISLSGDLAFSHQHGIYGFKFPKRFLEISFRDLTLFVILII